MLSIGVPDRYWKVVRWWSVGRKDLPTRIDISMGWCNNDKANSSFSKNLALSKSYQRERESVNRLSAGGYYLPLGITLQFTNVFAAHIKA
jgi:hypothetical protein